MYTIRISLSKVYLQLRKNLVRTTIFVQTMILMEFEKKKVSFVLLNFKKQEKKLFRTYWDFQK